MPTVLITGAGRGLGWEFSRQYVADGWDVIATCRNPVAKAMLADLGQRVAVYEADMRAASDLDRLAADIGRRPIDVLIANAAIGGPREMTFGSIDPAVWAEVMAINVFAPLRLVELLAENIAASEQKKIVALSSVLGSIGAEHWGGTYMYRSSKAALNSVMKQISHQFRRRDMTTIMLHPGWVRTDMGGANALIEPSVSVTALRRLIARAGPMENGRFFNYDGVELAW